MFQQKGQFAGSEVEWSQLSQHYGGNPLALKLVAAATQELFNGTIASLLKYAQQGVLVVEHLRDLLEGQFNRLSTVEQQVMYWMAISREPVSFAELEKDIVTVASKRKLLEASASKFCYFVTSESDKRGIFQHSGHDCDLMHRQLYQKL